jgi:hypothetical protein
MYKFCGCRTFQLIYEKVCTRCCQHVACQAKAAYKCVWRVCWTIWRSILWWIWLNPCIIFVCMCVHVCVCVCVGGGCGGEHYFLNIFNYITPLASKIYELQTKPAKMLFMVGSYVVLLIRITKIYLFLMQWSVVCSPTLCVSGKGIRIHFWSRSGNRARFCLLSSNIGGYSHKLVFAEPCCSYDVHHINPLTPNDLQRLAQWAL